MAATYGTLTQIVAGNKRLGIMKVTGDTSYATGGYDIAASRFGMGSLDVVLMIPAQAGLDFSWDTVNSKVKFLYPQGGDGVTNAGSGKATIAASTATPASGATAVTSTAAQPAIPVTFGAFTQDTAPSVEVQSTKDVHTYSVYCFAVGN